MQNKAISSQWDVLGGTPVFSGTRVPIRILIEHLEAGDRLADYLDSYPTVSRDQAELGAVYTKRGILCYDCRHYGNHTSSI